MPRRKPEDAFWRARPVLAQMRSIANSKGQSPWPVLGWAIVRALHTVPYKVCYQSIIGRQALNSLVGISGPTGAGKTISQRLLEDHFVFPDNDPSRPYSKSWEGLIPPGSGESMPDRYVEFDPLTEDEESGEIPAKDRLSNTLVWRHPNHAAVFFFDEVGMLASRSSRQGSTLVDYMKEGWSGSEFGRTLASGKGVILPRESYRFACVINTQPKRAGILFSEEAVAGGLQGRFLWFDVTADINRDLISREPVEKFPIPAIDWAGVDSIQALDVMDNAHIQHHWDALDGLISETESHILLTQAKVAVALAVLDGRAELNQEDWDLSQLVIDHTVKTRTVIEQALVEENRLAVIRDGKRAAVKVALSEEEKHKVNVEATAAAILRLRERTGKKKPGKNDLSQRQRDYKEEAEEFLRLNPDWRAAEEGNR
jgi:hypothetical protein